MRKRLRRCLVAATVAVAVGLAPTAHAAQAAPTNQPQALTINWGQLVVAVATRLLSGGGGSDDSALQAAVREILAAVEQAKTELISHADLIAAADVQACARQHTIEFADIDNMSRTVLQLWAQSATGCATLATQYVNTLTTPQAVDNIGFVVGGLFAIVIAARGRAGLTNGTTLVIQDQIRAYEAVVAKLTPTNCVKRRLKEPGFPPDKWWECTAYNGDMGESDWVTGTNVEPIRTQAEDRAARNTSRPAAQAGLPPLRAVM